MRPPVPVAPRSVCARFVVPMLLLVPIVAFATPAFAQSVVVVVRPAATDALLASDPWNVAVTNAGAGALDVVLEARVTESTHGVVYVARSGPIRFPVGTRVLDGRQVGTVSATFADPAVSRALDHTGHFPDGSYTVCITAFSTDGAALGSACLDQRVSSVLPPALLTPYNRSRVDDPLILWSWFVQSQTGAGEPVTCDLRVVEILPNQSPEEALRLNPPTILRENLSTSAWQTSELARGLKPDHTYAWQVVSRRGGVISSESEIWTFTFEPPGALAAAAGSAAATSVTAMPAVPTLPRVAGISPAPVLTPVAAPPPTLPPAALADSSQRAIRLRVDSRISGEAANRPGRLSGTAADVARIELDPTLDIYGSPLALSLLLSSDRSRNDTELRRGTIGFDGGAAGLEVGIRQRVGQRVEQLRGGNSGVESDTLLRAVADTAAMFHRSDSLLALVRLDPVESAQQLQQLGLLSRSEAQVARLPAFAFGSVVPDYSRLSLSAATINGGTVEYNPGRFYGAATVGKVERVADPALVAPPNAALPALFENLYAMRLGIGRKNGNHVFATALFANDDDQARAILALDDSAGAPGRRENLVLGLAGRTTSRDARWIADAEVDAALFTPGTGATIHGRPAPAGIARILGARLHDDSAVDWAGTLRATYASPSGTQLVAGTRFVGPGYVSVGAPGLRRDLLQADGSVNQSLLRGRLSLALQTSYEQSGVELPEFGSSLVRRIAGRGEWHASRLPSLSVAFTRNDQSQRPGGFPLEIRQRSDQLSVRMRGDRSFGAAHGLALVSFDLIEGRSPDPAGAHLTRIEQSFESLTLPARWSLEARAVRTETHAGLAAGNASVWTVEESVLHGIRACEATAGLDQVSGATSRGLGWFAALGFDGHHGVSADLRWDHRRFTDAMNPDGRQVEDFASLVLRTSPVRSTR